MECAEGLNCPPWLDVPDAPGLGVELDEDGEEDDEPAVTGSGAQATAPSGAGSPDDGRAGEASRQAQPGPRDRLQDQELDEFRRFLESVDPDDFADGEKGQG